MIWLPAFRAAAGLQRTWRSVWLCAACLPPLLVPLHAQADTGVQALSLQELAAAQQAEAARLKQDYQDRYLNPGDAALGASGPEAEPAAEGRRSWLVETRLQRSTASATGLGDYRANEAGLRVDYRRESLNYGDWLLRAEGRASSSQGDGLGLSADQGARRAWRASVFNFGLPLTEQWRADSALGDVDSALTAGLARSPYQLLPVGTALRGASTRLYSEGAEWRAGWGLRGNALGSPYQGFERSQGQLAWLGRTAAWGAGGYWAWQVNRAQDIAQSYSGFLPTDGQGRQDVQSWAVALGQTRSAGLGADVSRWRVSWLGSQRSAATGLIGNSLAQALYLEASQRWGRATHALAAHLGQPALYFADQRLYGGSAGAAWRVDYAAPRWSGSLGLDHERAHGDVASFFPSYERTVLSADANQVLNRSSSLGGNLSLVSGRYGQAAGGLVQPSNRSAFVYAYYQTHWADWPTTRLAWLLRQNQQILLNSVRATGQELQWEQDWWATQAGVRQPELHSILGYAWDRSAGATSRYPSAALRWRNWLDDGRSLLQAQVRYSSTRGHLASSQGFAGHISTERELGGGWRAGLSASLNEARTTGLALPNFVPAVYSARERVLAVFLRWEEQSGRAYAVQGQRAEPGAYGTGQIAGQVFLDADGDGRQQSNERGAAQVEVVLDGRYRVLTDAQGRFEFPVVAAGAQQLTVNLDSVPLPWTLAQPQGLQVQVPLRGTVWVDVPLQRLPVTP